MSHSVSNHLEKETRFPPEVHVADVPWSMHLSSKHVSHELRSCRPSLRFPYLPQAARKSRETKVVRPRTPPPPRPSPPPNLRHRPSLRCPTRLAQQQETDSDSGGSSQPRRSAAHEGGRRGAGKGAKKTVITANGVRGGGGDGGEAAKQQAIQEIPKPGVGVAVARGMEGADSYGRTRPASSGRTVEETYDGRSVPWGQEKAASAEGGGRGYKRSLEDGAVERAKQRPRKLEAPRPEIPADAVIVEVRPRRA